MKGNNHMNGKFSVTGIQHIGLPVRDYAGTAEFYKSPGFSVLWQAADRDCIFMKINEAVVEIYAADEVHPAWGAWDHIALNTDNIDEAYRAVREAGHRLAEGENGPVFLPYFKKGVRYFTIIGPNSEKIEFNQIVG